ncbi:hypothetical protein DSL72_004757 [Monilinia vaccinii-corymbosi]|uniref:Carboxypeptidase n=1 Tax=Monilinia vaccinii-corymbosi TaxID=61207 RepID=A0A8A3NX42_9HELO|nr:hypothetical protein DSL72_004757 [Monilinia vaccinii-corymbosi]
MISSIAAGLALFTTVNAVLDSRGLPLDPTGVKTLVTPQNITIRYKEPGKEGVCETTPGVNSYSGYIDLDANSHTFFWFFEARKDPGNAPFTVWLNGGPGSDSLIGAFQEIGPCFVTQNLTTELNPYSWNENSNMLFLSQPVGTGFSYASEGVGKLSRFSGAFEETSPEEAEGRYPVINATEIDTTALAAVAAWHILQGFVGGLNTLDPKVNLTSKKEFNLWAESYGGHWGPAFYRYFYDRNEEIANGTIQGTQLEFNSLGIVNGMVDAYSQFPFFPEFAVNNTYGIKGMNDTLYEFAKFALNMWGGCLAQIDSCRLTNFTSTIDHSICSYAAAICRGTVEAPFELYSEFGYYDIRQPWNVTDPPDYFVDYLNLDSVRNAIGVNLNYSASNSEIYYAFQLTGDFIYPTFLKDVEYLLDNDVAVSFVYGDADYICNWMGGEAASLAANYTHSAEFAAAGYAPFMVDGKEYGAVRQHGKFSFVRIYDAGHKVPYYQRKASLELFNRVSRNLDVAEGKTKVTSDYSTVGPSKSTHRNTSPPPQRLAARTAPLA